MPNGSLLTILDAPPPEPGDEEAAYWQLRRLANRHGCHEGPDPFTEGATRNHCKYPDPSCAECAGARPERHNADVRYLHQWLQMTGLEPYDAKPRTGFTPSGPANTGYRRP